jgi:pimeloyl-ACP methyl ester carboxylesterase
VSLTKPPSSKPQRGIFSSVLRLIVIVVTVVLLGGLVWAFTVANQIDRAETVDPTLAPPGRFVAVPGLITIHLREGGRPTSPAVLFIHDFDVAGGRQWQALADELGGYRAIMPDLVGFGYSPRLEDQSRLHTVFGKAEVLAALLREMEIESAAVVGAGSGAAVAAQLAATDPGLVDKLVLVGAEIYGPQPAWHGFFSSWPIVGDAYNFTLYGASPTATRRYQHGCDDGGWCPDADAMAIREEAARVVGTAESLTALAATPPASTLPADLSRITAPTLILWGELDPLTPVSQGEQLKTAIAGAELRLVPGSQHRPHLEDPVATAAFIAAFLSS